MACHMKLRFCSCLVIFALFRGDHASMVLGQQRTPAPPRADRADATYRGGLVTPPLPKPRFTLTDTSGAAYDFWAKTEGSVTLLFFGYTYCPDQCPLHLANIAVGLKKLPHTLTDHVKLVFVTTDPARDTSHVLRQWLDQFDTHFVGLTGSDAAIEAAQRTAGVPLATRPASVDANYGVAHASFVLAYTKDNLAHVIYPSGVGAQDWVHDLPLLIKESWERR